MTQRAAPNPSDFLPLSAQQFHILLSLARQDRHGYGVIQDVAARTGETMGTARCTPRSRGSPTSS